MSTTFVTTYRGRMATPPIGELLRTWRARRSRSQLDLAIEVGVSARHLSFVETGRSRPSAELVLALAEGLDVPLRERNTMLLAAGFAPRYPCVSLDDDSMRAVTASLRRLLDAHDPFPGLVLDRAWNVVLANRAAGALMAVVPPSLCEPTVNVFRVSLHPEGLAAVTTNFDEWGAYLLRQLRRLVTATDSPELQALEDEVRAYPNVVALERRRGVPSDDVDVVLPCELELGGHHLSLFTTLTTFGTPQDITLDELMIELFFPADDITDQFLRAAADPTQPKETR